MRIWRRTPRDRGPLQVHQRDDLGLAAKSLGVRKASSTKVSISRIGWLRSFIRAAHLRYKRGMSSLIWKKHGLFVLTTWLRLRHRLIPARAGLSKRECIHQTRRRISPNEPTLGKIS